MKVYQDSMKIGEFTYKSMLATFSIFTNILGGCREIKIPAFKIKVGNCEIVLLHTVGLQACFLEFNYRFNAKVTVDEVHCRLLFTILLMAPFSQANMNYSSKCRLANFNVLLH